MLFRFYGYTIRATQPADIELARDVFWLKQEPGRENFIVFEGANEKIPLGFFQTQHVGNEDQVRLHFQAAPRARAKNILRGITKLVPLIEKALVLRGVRAIFFTSHSAGMAQFVKNHHGYRWVGDSVDGMIMAKNFSPESRVPSLKENPSASARNSGLATRRDSL